MSKLLNELYVGLPRSIQNLLVSAYGAFQRKVRFGGALPSPYNDLRQLAQMPNSAIKDLQNIRLRALVSHAVQNVPHYRDLFKARSFQVDDISVDNLAHYFPVLEKSSIVSDPSRFHDQIGVGSALKLFTSGTSGSPMPIWCSQEARRLNYAYLRNLIESAGSRIAAKSVTFAGRVLFSTKEDRVFWRKDWVNNVLYCSSYYISERTVRSYVEAIEKWNPEYIDSYPSAVYEIARYINRNGVQHKIRPKFILTSSETLTGEHRSEIERAFACRVIDQYGCTEMAVLANRDGERYQVEPLYSLVETGHRHNGEGLPIITTGLINFSMPLIRYRIGDLVEELECDENWPMQAVSFKAVIGREDDVILTPEGRRIGRMDPVFKGIEGIARAQIIQDERSAIRVLVERLPGDDRLNETQLIQNIQNRTSEAMKIEIQYVNQVPLSKSGKFKAVISRIRS